MRYEIWDRVSKGYSTLEISRELNLSEIVVNKYKKIVELEEKIADTGNEVILEKYIFLGLRAYPITRVKDIRNVIELVSNLQHFFDCEYIQKLSNAYVTFENKIEKSIKVTEENLQSLKIKREEISLSKKNYIVSLNIFVEVREIINTSSYSDKIKDKILDVVGVYKGKTTFKIHLVKEIEDKFIEMKEIKKIDGFNVILNMEEMVKHLGNIFSLEQTIERVVKQDKVESHLVSGVIPLSYDANIREKISCIEVLEKQHTEREKLLTEKLTRLKSKKIKKDTICKKVQFEVMKLMSSKGCMVSPAVQIGGHIVFIGGYDYNSRMSFAIINEQEENYESLTKYFNYIYTLESNSLRELGIISENGIIKESENNCSEYSEMAIKRIDYNNKMIMLQEFMS